MSACSFGYRIICIEKNAIVQLLNLRLTFPILFSSIARRYCPVRRHFRDSIRFPASPCPTLSCLLKAQIPPPHDM